MSSTRSVSSSCASSSCDSTYDPKSINPDEADNIFTSPTGSKLSVEKEKDVEKVCEELLDILEDCFLEDKKKDKGKTIEKFYKNEVLEGLAPPLQRLYGSIRFIRMITSSTVVTQRRIHLSKSTVSLHFVTTSMIGKLQLFH